jgi:hypothetical protein
VALSNAQRQARWRAKRDSLAARAISEDDSDREIVRKIVRAIGTERARILAGTMNRLITAVAHSTPSKRKARR